MSNTKINKMEFLRGLFKEKNTQNCRSLRYHDSDSGDRDYHKFGLQNGPASPDVQETDSSWNCRQPNCVIHPLRKLETNAVGRLKQEQGLPIIIVMYEPKKKEVTLEDYEWSDELMDVTLNDDKSLDEQLVTRNDEEISEVLGITEIDKFRPIVSVVNPSVEVLGEPTSLQTTIRQIVPVNIVEQQNQPISQTTIRSARPVKHSIDKSQQTSKLDFKERMPEQSQTGKSQQKTGKKAVETTTSVVKNVTNKNCRRTNMKEPVQMPVKNVMQRVNPRA